MKCIWPCCRSHCRAIIYHLSNQSIYLSIHPSIHLSTIYLLFTYHLPTNWPIICHLFIICLLSIYHLSIICLLTYQSFIYLLSTYHLSTYLSSIIYLSPVTFLARPSLTTLLKVAIPSLTSSLPCLIFLQSSYPPPGRLYILLIFGPSLPRY